MHGLFIQRSSIFKLKSFGQFWSTWRNSYRAWKVDKSPQLPLLHLPFWQPARGSCKSENWRNWTPLNRVRSKVTINLEFLDRPVKTKGQSFLMVTKQVTWFLTQTCHSFVFVFWGVKKLYFQKLDNSFWPIRCFSFYTSKTKRKQIVTSLHQKYRRLFLWQTKISEGILILVLFKNKTKTENLSKHISCLLRRLSEISEIYATSYDCITYFYPGG